MAAYTGVVRATAFDEKGRIIDIIEGPWSFVRRYLRSTDVGQKATWYGPRVPEEVQVSEEITIAEVTIVPLSGGMPT